MISGGKRNEQFRRHFDTGMVGRQIVLCSTTAAVALLMSGLAIWQIGDLLVALALLAFSALFGTISWFSFLGIRGFFIFWSSSPTVVSEGGTAVQLELAGSRLFITSNLVFGSLFLVCGMSFLATSLMTADRGQFVGPAVVGIIAATLLLAYLAVFAFSVPVPSATISSNGIFWEWSRGNAKNRQFEVSIPWASVSEISPEFSTHERSFFRLPVLNVATSHPLNRPDRLSDMNGSMIKFGEDGSVQLGLHVFPENINVLHSLMSAFLDSSRSGVPVSDELIRDLVKAPPAYSRKSS